MHAFTTSPKSYLYATRLPVKMQQSPVRLGATISDTSYEAERFTGLLADTGGVPTLAAWGTRGSTAGRMRVRASLPISRPTVDGEAHTQTPCRPPARGMAESWVRVG